MFGIHEAKTITGKLIWSAETSKGTMEGREEPIVIQGTYRLLWQDYPEPSKASYGRFRYLLVKVEKGEGP